MHSATNAAKLSEIKKLWKNELANLNKTNKKWKSIKQNYHEGKVLFVKDKKKK